MNKNNKEYYSRILKFIRLRTFPLAIKLVTNDECLQGQLSRLRILVIILLCVKHLL